MPNHTSQILAVSTFANDTVIFKDSGRVEKCRGGPGFWIKREFDRLQVPHHFLLGTHETSVEVEIVHGEILPGKNITHGSRILVRQPGRYDGILINILDEFDLTQISKLEGAVVLDIANYTRGGPFNQERRMAQMPPLEIRRRIDILKANHEELPYVPQAWRDEQMNERTLLHTLGPSGLDLWCRGRLTHFDAPPIKPKNALGAGDTLGAAFLAFYLMSGGDVLVACRDALLEVEQLFREKEHGR